MNLVPKTPHPTKADAEKAHKMEKQRTDDAIKETDRIDQGMPGRRPGQPNGDGRHAHD